MKFANLQVGRFLAAAFVLAFHASYHGHDILGVHTTLADPLPAYYTRSAIAFFFALSGFVLAHAVQTTPLGRFLRFRLLRLFAPYWVALAAVLVIRWAIGNQVPFDWKGLRHAFTLWPVGPNRAAYALGVEWTLVYEFYLSMVMVPLAALGRRWGLGLGAAAMLVLCGGQLALAPAGYFPVFPRLGDVPQSVMNVPFFLGVLAYLFRDRFADARGWAVLGAVVALTAGAMFHDTVVARAYALQSVGAALLVVGFGTGPQVADRHPLAVAGEWSYGIYLVHVPVMTAFYALAARHGFVSPDERTVLFGGVLALAAGSAYGAVEWAIYKRLRTRLRGAKPAVAPASELPARRAA